MAMYSLLRNTPEPSVQQINEAMQGMLIIFISEKRTKEIVFLFLYNEESLLQVICADAQDIVLF